MKKLILAFISTFVLSSFASANEIARGEFAPVDSRHMIQGSFSLHEDGAALKLLFDSNFKVTAGPDLRIVLRDSKGQKPMVVVAPLAGNDGQQEYDLSAFASSISDFDEVLIYCAKYHVDFGVGKFR